MNNGKQCVHCVISGKVQGVWFRANTQKKAQELGVTGWVRNLPDGCVEVKAAAEVETLKQFIVWLEQGPELAKVEEVTIKYIAYEEFKGFAVIPYKQ